MRNHDRAFLRDYLAHGSLNHLVAAIALAHAYQEPDCVATELFERAGGAPAPAAAEEALRFNTAARVQSIAVAKLVGELMAAVEDCGAFCFAVQHRREGLLERYLWSSPGEVADWYRQVPEKGDVDLATILDLKAAAFFAKARRARSRSTVLRLIPSRQAMAALASPSRWKSRRTSAQSST